jgi:hypothetical protein
MYVAHRCDPPAVFLIVCFFFHAISDNNP